MKNTDLQTLLAETSFGISKIISHSYIVKDKPVKIFNLLSVIINITNYSFKQEKS